MRVARLLACAGSLAVTTGWVHLDDQRWLSTADVCERMLPSVFRIVLLDPNTGSHAGVGSGFCIRPDGTSLTAYHVINNSAQLLAKFDNGEKCPVKVISGDEATDIAIIKVSPRPPAKLGSSALLRRGEQVIHFGNTMASDSVDIDVGYINKTRDDIPVWMRQNVQGDVKKPTSGLTFILTQGSARPGFSGGPLVNMSAEVIGLISRMYMHFDGTVLHHEGASIPIDFVMQVVESLERHGRLEKPYVGISFKPIEQGLALLVVQPGSPAAQGGLQVGDLVVEMNGVSMRTQDDFYHVLGYRKHAELKIKVQRGRKTLDLLVHT